MSENSVKALLVDPVKNLVQVVEGDNIFRMCREHITDAHGFYNYPHYPVEGVEYFFTTADSATSFKVSVESRDVKPGYPLVHGPVLVFSFFRDEFGSPDLSTLSEDDIERLMARVIEKDGCSVLQTD